MKFIIEDKIPFIKGIFERVGEVVYLPASKIDRSSLIEADVLISRTRPYLSKELLEGTGLKLIGSATIGTDHIALDYCKENGIKVVNAPGCNAPAVAQWTLSSILHIDQEMKRKVMAVVGVGNVGKLVADWATRIGYEVLQVDPYRAEAEGEGNFFSLEEAIRDADIITFHTPLTRDGKYPTYHLANKKFFQSLRNKPIILNAARGAVVNTLELLEAYRKGEINSIAIDCWEDEPEINRALLGIASIATPHIAGYSIEGKIRASNAMIEAVNQEFGTDLKLVMAIPTRKNTDISAERILKSYNPNNDTQELKNNPSEFEKLRDNYNYRKEP